MEKEQPVVAHDFLGLERSASEPQSEQPNGHTNMNSALSFPSSDNRGVLSVAMSLRTRENSAMALKHIFDQINESSEASHRQPMDIEAAGNQEVPFLEKKIEDGKVTGDGLTEQTDIAPETVLSKPSANEHRETGRMQQTRDMCRGWDQNEDGGDLLSLRSAADSDGRRTMGNGRSCRVPSEIKPSSMLSPLHQQETCLDNNSIFGFQITETKATPSPPAQRHRESLLPFLKTAGDLDKSFDQLHRFAAHPEGFDYSTKRATDLDLSFRKTQVQDPAALLLQRTAFGSPISVRSAYQDAPTAAMEWPIQGLYSQSSGALRPNVPERQPTAQLTIFYSGMVNVYDNVPADKAHAIMLLAGSGNSRSSPSTTNAHCTTNNVHFFPPPEAIKFPNTSMATKVTTTSVTPSISSTASGFSPALQNPLSSFNSTEIKHCSSTTPEILKQLQPQSVISTAAAKRSHAELPHARKASLARFLEKRKDRVQSKPGVKASEGTDVTCSETPSSPKRQCTTRSSSPSFAIPKCNSALSIQKVPEDQVTGTNRAVV